MWLWRTEPTALATFDRARYDDIMAALAAPIWQVALFLFWMALVAHQFAAAATLATLATGAASWMYWWWGKELLRPSTAETTAEAAVELLTNRSIALDDAASTDEDETGDDQAQLLSRNTVLS